MSDARTTGRLSGFANRVSQQETGLSLFLKASVFDYLLVLVLATALAYTTSYGFDSAPHLRGNFLLEAAVAAPLLAALFVSGWSKRALLPSVAMAIAVSVGILGACAVLMPSGTSFMDGMAINDVPENYMVWGMVVIACAVLSYVLSRRSVLLVVLSVLSIIACGAVQYLYRDWMATQHGLAASLVVFACLVALIVYQRYRLSAMSTARMAQQAFGKVFAFGSILGIACAGIAVAVFFALVSPLAPDTPQFKPFNDYYQRPIVEYSGPVDKQNVKNDDLTSNNTNDNTNKTNQPAPGGMTSQNTNSGSSTTVPSSATQLLESYEENNQKEKYDSVGYDLLVKSIPVLAIVLALALIAAVIARIYLREHRLRKMRDRSKAYQVVTLYEFLVGRFEKVGVEYAPSLTPLAFALASVGQLAPYGRNKRNADFIQVTMVYQRAAFGRRDISDDEYNDVVEYYRAFFANARRQLGWRRWLFFKFWTV